MSEDFNMSMRKFLKQVGVTSQQQIEAAIRDGSDVPANVHVRMVLTSEDIELNHVVEGTIRTGGAE